MIIIMNSFRIMLILRIDLLSVMTVRSDSLCSLNVATLASQRLYSLKINS